MYNFVLLACLFLNNSSSGEMKLINYFVKNRTDTGLVQDRESNPDVASIAATGFGMSAWAIAAERKIMPKEKAREWINQTIDFVFLKNPKKNRGWLYHFLDKNGNPLFSQEVSSIDTALFYLGAKKAAEILKCNQLKSKIQLHIDNIDINWMLTNDNMYPNKKYFSHGIHWNNDTPGFLTCDWEEYSEGILIYKLFNIPYDNPKVSYDLPLFVYYYPLCFFDDPEMVEKLKKAIAYQTQHYPMLGVTACDGPTGYSVNDITVISPLTLWAIDKYTNNNPLHGLKVPRTTPSFHLKSNWVAEDRIGIDDGSCLLMLFGSN